MGGTHPCLEWGSLSPYLGEPAPGYGGSHSCLEWGGFSPGWSGRQARGSCSPWSPPLCWDHLRPAVTGMLLFWAPHFCQQLDLEDEPQDPNHGDGSPSLWERVRSGWGAAPL